MTPRFIDTNIILRYLLGDDPQQSPASRALLRAIERGETTGWTSDLAIAEVVFVLSNRRTYNFDRATLSQALTALLNLPGLRIPNKRILIRAFEVYSTLPIDFIDAYHVALLESRGETELYSFDRDFDRIPGLKRIEPTE